MSNVLSAEEMTNLYLYGTKIRPSDLLDTNIIRPSTETTTTSVDINEYMKNGAGRFASPAFFELVKLFFSPTSSALKPGSYSKSDLGGIFGLDYYGLNLQQWAYADGTDDYAERVYIWNSGEFKISDNARFIVKENGDRYIENFAIEPRDEDNFDFESNDLIAQLGNQELEKTVDPSGIGRKVKIKFDNTRQTTTFTYSDYQTAASSAVLPDPSLLLTLNSEIMALTDKLFQSGSTAFLYDSKPILYGTQQNDTLAGQTSLSGVDITTHRQLGSYSSNGMVYVGGLGIDTLMGGSFDDVLVGNSGDDVAHGGQGDDELIGGEDRDILHGDGGNDTLRGGNHRDLLFGGGDNDILYGGSGDDDLLGEIGNDILVGENGADRLEGGQGIDTYIAEAGDTILDSDGLGRVIFDSHSLVGGRRNESDPAGQYRSEDGSLIYTLAGSTLRVSITGQASTLTIENFDKNAASLGIVLRDPSDPAPSSAITGTEQADWLELRRETNGSVRAAILRGGILGVPASESYVYYDGQMRSMFGAGGNDTLTIVDIRGLEGAEVHGGNGNDNIHGDWNEINDYLHNGLPLPSQTAGAYLYGDGGDDEIYGSLRQDLVDGGTGHDLLDGEQGSDVVDGSAGNDFVDGDEGSDIVLGSDGNDRLHGGAQNDYLLGGAGNDRIYGDANSAVPLTWDGYYDRITVLFENSAVNRDLYILKEASVSDSGMDSLYGGAGEDQLYGGAGDDTLDGGNDNDTVQGEGGNDVVIGGAGNDLIYGDKSDRTFRSDAEVLLQKTHPAGGTDTLRWRLHSDSADVAGNDTLIGGAGTDFLFGGGGSDTYKIELGDGRDYIHDEGGAADAIEFGMGISPSDMEFSLNGKGELIIQIGDFRTQDVTTIADWGTAKSNIETFRFSDGTSWSGRELPENIGFFVLDPNEVTTDVRMTDSTYYLPPSVVNNNNFAMTIRDSGGDFDTLKLIYAGGGGPQVDSPSFSTFDYEGKDLILNLTYTLTAQTELSGSVTIKDFFTTQGEIEKFHFGTFELYTQNGAIEEPRYQIGTFGSFNQINGLNLYMRNWLTDRMIYTGTASADRFLASNTSRNETYYGHEGDDEFVGDSGRDTFFGGSGNDIMRGERGYDSYHVDPNDQDIIIDDGTGEVAVSIDSIYLPKGVRFQDVLLVRDGDDLLIGQTRVSRYFERDLNPTGSNLYAFRIEHIHSDDDPLLDIRLPEYLTQRGFYGTLDGTTGDDVLTGEVAAPNWIRGFAGNDVLSGGDSGDLLEGGAGTDTLAGSYGNDIYVFATGDGADTINEVSGEDRVRFAAGIQPNDIRVFRSGSNLVLGHANGVDQVTLTNWFTRTDEGADRVEFADGTVWEVADLTTFASILRGTSGNDTLTGTSSAETLYGFEGNDTLNGGTNADTMYGGTGDDIYTVDNVGDAVIEYAGEGTDTVKSSKTYALAANVEKLTLTGTSAINGTGNTLNNVLTGNSANNTLVGHAGDDTLDGGSGSDTMRGGVGHDIYVVNVSTDVVSENANEGTDTVKSSITLTLGVNVENLTLTGSSALNGTGNELNNVLTGNSANNTLTGNAGDDTLDGGSGSDTMRGGVGHDTYVVNVATDVITENANEGTDTVRSSITLTVGANVENLTLTGTSALNGTGNELNNVLTGNSAANILTGNAGDDTLDGGSGTDTMRGGIGNDVYVVNVATDVVTENLNEGTDTVRSAVTLTLGANVENLTLTGTSAINGTGNTLANTLLGNGAINTLNAGSGDDTLQGEGGNDTLDGGAGNDRYVFGRADGQDRVLQNDSSSTADVLALEAGIAADQLWFTHTGNDLKISVIGTSDHVTFVNWYTGSANHVDRIETAAGAVLLDTQVELLISAMAGMTPPAAGQLDLSPEQQAQLAPALAASWQGDVAA